MKKQYKRVLLGVGIALLALLIIYKSAAPLPVAAITLAAGPQRDQLTEEGTLYALRQWNLFPPANLMVQETLRQSGDAVEAGDLLLRLDDASLQQQWQGEANSLALQLAALRGELEAASRQKEQYSPALVDHADRGFQAQLDGLAAQLTVALDNYNNTKVLYEAGAESRSNFDLAEASVKELESAIEERQAAAALQSAQMAASYAYYEEMEKSLGAQIQTLEGAASNGVGMYSAQLAYQSGQTSITAPVAGKVLFIDVKTGDMTDVTKPVAAVYQEGAAGAEVFLTTADAALVYPGLEAQVVLKGREKEYRPATVTSVAAYATEVVSELGLAESRVPVKVTLADGFNLILGQKVDVDFILATKADALAVPKSAVFEYQDGYAVMTAVEGKAKLTVVEKEFDTDTATVVKSGLKAGDTVILTPKLEGLRDGTRIKVR